MADQDFPEDPTLASSFDPHNLDKSVIALPLLLKLAADDNARTWYRELRALVGEEPDKWEAFLKKAVRFNEVFDTVDERDLHFSFPWRFLPKSVYAFWISLNRQARHDWLLWFRALLNSPTKTWESETFAVIIDLNLQHPEGRKGARDWVVKALNDLVPNLGTEADENAKNQYVQQYLFVRLKGDDIRRLVRQDAHNAALLAVPAGVSARAIYRIWPDFPINALVNKSISTVKADAAQVSYAASGQGIVWAVLDSGINEHEHFTKHENLKLLAPLEHRDFTNSPTSTGPLSDGLGHGTHVAGIIAGEMSAPTADPPEYLRAFSRERDGMGDVDYVQQKIPHISGIAPKCKLMSLKVMDDKGQGEASNLIAAIALIQELNGHGRNLLIQGVNMSVGYPFEPEWFACGQSPLCVEVNRLVRSGVVVVVAAGNTGYGVAQSKFNGQISAGMSLTINDPGNADLAITVGATHRDMPHVYGVSYFSSKGPTGDGRLKPDLVAPGEKIISCAAGTKKQEMESKVKQDCHYLEQSGTSMAAPHVSGAVAAFLSIRREFIGYPEKVKGLFLESATDLKRERYFQGAGLVDLMRAIQSV
ncbi:S8 family peptidase [Hymenobacter sp. 5317J-9]|uniref:S8 family peptidase n=1 Tax=Hymenobacter sp. 5317J-9 TaxID=2932250 RepID=UPI001FD68F18|nr:S8 family peptidase [Hymenobacter sp. 5317J-9]UOQ95918.1 S8 family peptidase [Hymenobacter sp. 5317J-9]